MKLSRISAFHYFRLGYRGVLFLWAFVLWCIRKTFRNGSFVHCIGKYQWLFALVWMVLAVEMMLRFFPSKTESMGCQKQFKRNYMPVTGKTPDTKKINHGVLASALAWIGLNGVFFVLHRMGIIADGTLILIALFYSISDMICILFFCPFQSWMMKNRCCTACRIYNWDFFMICTPLMFIPHWYTWSLATLSIILLVRWEYVAFKHPEFISRETNRALACKNCEEKLCRHKTQLQRLWQRENII